MELMNKMSLNLREIVIVLVLILMVLLGLISIFLENFQNPEGAATSFTVTAFILGKKGGDKYYSLKRRGMR